MGRRMAREEAISGCCCEACLKPWCSHWSIGGAKRYWLAADGQGRAEAQAQRPWLLLPSSLTLGTQPVGLLLWGEPRWA